MCIILAAWQAHRDYPLVIAANRDEFFARPTRAAGFWSDAPDILAGRDLSAGGTWLGVTRTGRFAALTNYRDPAREKPGAESRGALVRGFLESTAPALDYLSEIEQTGQRYNGFNLLVCDGTTLACHNNVDARTRMLEPGIHGLSNHVLNTPWPKVTAAKQALNAALHTLPDAQPLFEFLRDETVAQDYELPSTGIPLERERWLSSIFVRSDPAMGYGTRSSTVVLMRADGRIMFDEQEWLPDANAGSRRRFSFIMNR